MIRFGSNTFALGNSGNYALKLDKIVISRVLSLKFHWFEGA